MTQTIDFIFAAPWARVARYSLTLIRPANAGVVFNGCAVVFGGSFGSGGRHQEPGRVAASTRRAQLANPQRSPRRSSTATAPRP